MSEFEIVPSSTVAANSHQKATRWLISFISYTRWRFSPQFALTMFLTFGHDSMLVFAGIFSLEHQ